MKNESNVGILEAVEALTSIADLDFDKNLGIMQKNELRFQNQHVTFKTVEWMNQEEREMGMSQVKDVFDRVLNFINHFYEEEHPELDDTKTIEVIKNIMILVAEAGKKIDKYSSYLQSDSFKSVTESSDYKKLQEFYQRKISKVIDEGVLSRWILGVTDQVWSHKPTLRFKDQKPGLTKHIFMDLESVKRDTDYELFYIRKEDGSRFFSPRLIRNIKLVSDFGSIFSHEPVEDLLQEIPLWMNYHLQHIAESIYEQVKPELNLFFHEAFKFKDHEFVRGVIKCSMALMLSAHLKPQDHHNSEIKNSRDYFSDFLQYFRWVLKSREFEKIVLYPPKKGHTVSIATLALCRSLSKALYNHGGSLDAVGPLIHHLFEEGKKLNPKEERATTLWGFLNLSWQSMSRIIKNHPNGPLKKVIESIEEGDYNRFEPLHVDNVPHQNFTFYLPERQVAVLRIPSPVIQQTSNKAILTPEWTLFSSSHKATETKHLMVSFQDRTSWKECGRAFAIEKTPSEQPVMTLAVDTDFYHQTGLYFGEGDWNKFSDTLLDQVVDLQAGFFYSEEILDHLESVVPLIAENIHSVFFKNKKSLSRDERIVFLDLHYLMVSLIALDLTKAESVSFSCKDGLDTGNLFSAFCYCFFQLMNDDKPLKGSLDKLLTIIYAPPLLTRERLPIQDRFQRIVKSVRHLEELKQTLGFEAYHELVQKSLEKLCNSEISQAYIR